MPGYAGPPGPKVRFGITLKFCFILILTSCHQAGLITAYRKYKIYIRITRTSEISTIYEI